jgi:hypothetical protein
MGEYANCGVDLNGILFSHQREGNCAPWTNLEAVLLNERRRILYKSPSRRRLN